MNDGNPMGEVRPFAGWFGPVRAFGGLPLCGEWTHDQRSGSQQTGNPGLEAPSNPGTEAGDLGLMRACSVVTDTPHRPALKDHADKDWGRK